ncbi:GNAT family N-acetyltransferase [Actinoallomurus sp. CA-142502]|uniref:GNAT family N-acetyltransferase n=1 Tax=Actinoallomurus sp. CA-142502 TaxID=3239885 RepID=UPI003D943F15
MRRWRQVPDLGAAGTCGRCRGPLRSYVYRYHPRGSGSYERCVSYVWCSPCRRYAGQMVHVPKDEVLPDPLGDLPADERDAIRGSSRLVPYVDRVLTRTGAAPEPHWVITREPVETTSLLRDYFTDVASRYYGRPATEAEVDAALAEDPSDDLVCFLVGRRGGAPSGCVGLRLLGPGVTELTRLFVHPRARRTGGGHALLAAAEDAAVDDLRAHTMRLDTRHDLVEARALYAAHGYAEIPAYSHGPYAEHWFEKYLG